MTPLILRSHYSLMWGTQSPEKICTRAKALGYQRLALTDTDNLYGLFPFLFACRKGGLTPIVGAEITEPCSSLRVVCLCANDKGYGNLCKLITRRKQDTTFTLKNALPQFSEGLILLIKDPMLLSHFFSKGITVAAVMPRFPLSKTHPLREMARDLKVREVAAPGSFFLYPEEFALHQMLRGIDLNTSISRLTPFDVAPENAWLASIDAYQDRFAICPEAITATDEIADAIPFTGPEFGVVLPPFAHEKGQSVPSLLREAAYKGAEKRYDKELSEPVVERLEYELSIIEQMGFSSYFLVVQHIVKSSSRTCGRGSGAASLVAYCLNITNVCPIKHNLYFERFLNPGRKDPPDIDVDFAWDERDAVLSNVLEEFKGHAAMVSSHIQFQPRMAIRETAKVYGLPEQEIKKMIKGLPFFWHQSDLKENLAETLKANPETRHLDFIHPWPDILAMAQKLIEIPRYLSVHPGGIVITPNAIDTYVPIETAPKGIPVMQWDKESVEAAGLVKIDLLGNRSLGVIRDAIHNALKNGMDLDESEWEPEEDYATQEAISQGATMGCFYIESPAMRLLQQKTKVGDFEHLTIHSSIIRPAANAYIEEYIRRLHGGAWDPIHPSIADVLDETFGIMVYQEDVARVAVALAGFTSAEADGLRKILSKKDREHYLRDLSERFIRGAEKKGVPSPTIKAVWEMMMSFSGYSFCKPHSASYAKVSFQSAYLKVHHPAEFMAAVISNQGGFYSTSAYVSEARRMGLTILPPDVQKSQIRWYGKEKHLRVGFVSIKDLGSKTMARLVEAQRISPFHSLKDFIKRIRPDEREISALIHSGALDSLNTTPNRAVLLWESDRIRHHDSENTLFSDADVRDVPLPELPFSDPIQELRREFSVLGFLCAHHPIVLFKEQFKKMERIRCDQLSGFIGKKVTLAAFMVTGKVVRTHKGDPMEFITFEDETGLVETTFFPLAYRRFCHLIRDGKPFIITGKVEDQWGAHTLTVEKIQPILPVF